MYCLAGLLGSQGSCLWEPAVAAAGTQAGMVAMLQQTMGRQASQVQAQLLLLGS
jgi:hypothetical protein